MRRIEKNLKYIILSLCILIILLIADMFIIMYLSYKTDSVGALTPIPKKTIIEFAERRASGAELELLKDNRLFAMLIDSSGNVIWEYDLPYELPRHYTIQQIASFSRWYLQDYPVYTYIVDEGIVVVGLEKNSVWKHQLIYNTETMDAYIYAAPYVIFINIIVVLFVPFFVAKHDSRRREQERTTWIAGVSHDIRTPLSLVLGYADAVKNESTEAEIVKKAEIIEEQSIRLRTLITNLNTENKLTYGMGKWQKEPMLLPALMRDVMCDAANRASAAQYDFVIDIPDELEKLKVLCDKELTKRLLENLVNNAMIHNPQGCRISVGLTKKKLLFFKYYIITVFDNGCGVSHEQLKKLRTGLKPEKLSEHGLGIRLVRQIAALHHWQVRFGNNEKNGFYCKICVPQRKTLRNGGKNENSRYAL